MVQMEKALRGNESITLSANEGARWGLPRGIVVNARIENDFGYPHLKNNLHTPEYEKIYAMRKNVKEPEVFLIEQGLFGGGTPVSHLHCCVHSVPGL